MHAEQGQGHGLSLRNIEQRIQNHYADTGQFISQAQQRGWQTQLILPINGEKR